MPEGAQGPRVDAAHIQIHVLSCWPGFQAEYRLEVGPARKQRSGGWGDPKVRGSQLWLTSAGDIQQLGR